ncbi:MAG: hypothetical protein IJP75_01110 [Bacteroidaceae bacterium]|nr:hypothetical protein [Bacteroidaceae bacterium]
MKREITLKDVAGHATERTIWQLLLNLAADCGQGKMQDVQPQTLVVQGAHFVRKDSATGIATSPAFTAPEVFATGAASANEASDIWTLGALAFYAITGTDVFEGKGGATQTEKTHIPRISSAHASKRLSALLCQCLSYAPKDRPTPHDVQQLAQEALATPVVPRKRLASHTGKTYTTSLVKFWPEEMVPLLLVCLWMLLPSRGIAQDKSTFLPADIPVEMVNLVRRCIDLRSPANADKVSRAMDKDTNWTVMDELPLDTKGECTTHDAVDMFGLNDLGFRILKRHGGVTNAGGRFRDGRDPRYKYSLIEVTVKKRATVTYPLSGREGEQLFAIVPYAKDAPFKASIAGSDTFVDNGVCYVRLRKGLKKNDTFTLTLTNGANQHAAFAIINYNSRNHE